MNLYYLPAAVHVCATVDGLVFLDIARDKYIGFSGQCPCALHGTVENWPKCHLHPNTPSIASEVERSEAIQQLIAQGLLTTTTNGLSCNPSRGVAMAPTDSLMSRDIGRPSISCRHVIHFLRSWAYASWILRYRSLQAAVESVRKRKHPWELDAAETERTVNLVKVFMTARSFFFSSNDKCLLNALALVTFLSYYKQFPDWMIGVRTNPFSAHSWVQHRDILFDDTLEKICEYRTIFSV